MKEHLRIVLKALKAALKAWWRNDPFKESAAISYYAIFSLPGLLVVIIAVVGYFVGQDAINGQISAQITSTMGADTARQIQDITAKASESANSLWAAVLGVVTIALGATGVFAQFQQSLNTVWKVKADASESEILTMLKARILAFGLIMALAFVLIASLVVSSILAALGSWISGSFSDSLLIALEIANSLISLLVLSLSFALMFKYFPNTKVEWRQVWIGSVVTAVLFEMGKFCLGLYFGTAEPGSGYGAAGSIILILLWVSYSSMIILFGAEFTYAYSEIHGWNTSSDVGASRISIDFEPTDT
ncbi:MAG: YihY/virulence factor BrkB family protein [Ignavibacteria bacterium]|nr:YihY/virulence factor BrkB family protein [Ignavibacteria bacterium]